MWGENPFLPQCELVSYMFRDRRVVENDTNLSRSIIFATERSNSDEFSRKLLSCYAIRVCTATILNDCSPP